MILATISGIVPVATRSVGALPYTQGMKHTTTTTTLGAYIRTERVAKGLSPEAVAATGNNRVGANTLRLIERGSTPSPRPSTLRALAEALDLDYRHLLHLAGYDDLTSEPPLAPPEDIAALLKRAQEVVAQVSFLPLYDTRLGPNTPTAEFFPVPRSRIAGRSAAAFRVTGSSMPPDIPEGAVLCIDQGRAGLDGDLVLAWEHGNTALGRLARRGAVLEVLPNRGRAVTLASETAILGVVFGIAYWF